MGNNVGSRMETPLLRFGAGRVGALALKDLELGQVVEIRGLRHSLVEQRGWEFLSWSGAGPRNGSGWK